MTHPSPRAQSLVSNEANSPFIIPEGCSSLVVPNGVGAGAPNSPEGVGQGSQVGTLTDAQREAAIERAAKAIERHMAAVHEANNRVPHVFSDFADASASRWMANELRKRMEMLIAGRSAEQVARMERERGLDKPACANEGAMRA